MAQLQGLLIVLNDQNKIDPLLKTFLANDVRGCTILDSEGMTHHIVAEDQDENHFAALRQLIKNSPSHSKTLLVAASEAEIQRVVKLALEVIGDINKPDTGFMMTFPIDNVYGLMKK